MAHIQVPPQLPGILSLFATRPETAKPMQELADVLLRMPSSLSRGERELIATHVSSLNQCRFCTNSHSAIASEVLGGDTATVDAVKNNFRTAPVSEKLKALLAIAGKVQADARTVSETEIQAARKEGATDREIHDTVLIAAAFCMYNRYVDGLAAWTPDWVSQGDMYRQSAKIIAEHGYVR